MIQEMTLPMVFVHPVLAQEQVLGGEPTGTPTTTAPGTIGPNGTPAGQPAGKASNFPFLLPIVLIAGMFLIMSMSGRKEKKKRAAMLSTLGKRDKVRTAGGIIGTVVELKDDEVLIETDRASHTRLWLARGSVSTILDTSKRAKEQTNTDVDSLAEAESVSS